MAMLAVWTAGAAHAQDAGAVRGGWMTDVNGVRHILYRIVRGTTLTGVYCAPCDQPNAMAFIQDGAMNGGKYASPCSISPTVYPPTGKWSTRR